MKIQIPEIFEYLYKPAFMRPDGIIEGRFKAAWGGRGGGKSRAFADALLERGLGEKKRILCTREIQKSIRDSVHRLLTDRIAANPEFSAHYDPLETIIRGRNGTEFLFSGISGQTVDSIKSYEDVDLCFVEEAQSVTARSWNILVPTIRAEDQEKGTYSEIWASFNPVLDTDEAYQRFVVHPQEGSIVRYVNYWDNPWFPAVLEQERAHDAKTMSLMDYENKWEGKVRAAVEGAIYAEEIADATLKGRICNVPYDPMLKVHAVWDMGWDDSMSIILVQRLRSEIRIIGYVEDRFKKVDQYVGRLKSMNLNWGYDFLPWDGNATSRQTGKTDKQILEAFGRKVKITPNTDIESGIRQVRTIFPQLYFDKKETEVFLEHLRRYRRRVSESNAGGLVSRVVGGPLHDEHSNGADCIRYLALNIKHMTNEDEFVVPSHIAAQQYKPSVSSMGI